MCHPDHWLTTAAEPDARGVRVTFTGGVHTHIVDAGAVLSLLAAWDARDPGAPFYTEARTEALCDCQEGQE